MRYHWGAYNLYITWNLSIWKTSVCSDDCVYSSGGENHLSHRKSLHPQKGSYNTYSCDNIYIWSRRSFDFFCHDYQVLEMHCCAKYLWNQRYIAILLHFGLTKCILREHLKSAVFYLLSQPHSMEKIRGWVWERRRGFEGNECGAVPSVFISGTLTLLHPVCFHYHDSLARTRVMKARQLEGGWKNLGGKWALSLLTFIDLFSQWEIIREGEWDAPQRRGEAHTDELLDPQTEIWLILLAAAVIHCSWGSGLDFQKSEKHRILLQLD